MMDREASPPVERRLPVGTELQAGGGVHFRVWAPRRRHVVLALGSAEARQDFELNSDAHGYFSALVPRAKVGQRYGFCLDDDPRPYPDPASRRQPDGPHGLSEIVDPAAYAGTTTTGRG